MKRLLFFFAAFALLLPSVAQARTTRVFLTKGEQLATVKRSVKSGPAPAVQALLAGPTAAETKAGYGSAIPSGVTMTNAVVTDDARILDWGQKHPYASLHAITNFGDR